MLEFIQHTIASLTNTDYGLYVPLTAFILIDYIFGIILSIKTHRLSSKIGFQGIIRKFCIYLVSVVGHLLDQFVLSPETSVENLILLFYIANEGISILENLAKLGVPFPEKIKTVFLDLAEDPQENKK